MADNILKTIGEFVESAKAAGSDHAKIKNCVDAGLGALAAHSVPRDWAVHMLSSAVTSYAMNHDKDVPELIHVFAELENRKSPV